MELKERLENLRSAALRRIEKAARNSDAATVLESGNQLTRIEELLGRYETLEHEVKHLSNGKTPIMPKRQVTRAKKQTTGDTSSRNLAKRRRKEMIEANKLSVIPHRGSSIYKTPEGTRVGMAFATERQENRWFLGLPEDRFDVAVLLCETSEGPLPFVLPEALFDQHGEQLSRSKGQVKFNVKFDRDFVLLVPGCGEVALAPYLRNFSPIQD